ncbi:CMGC family protein kinase [Histomonas meleagridis]|uniref:CMGC family protein kinase n=1 Tax=Histomonas meleagridis TaxID=135588 RepID=UPI00355960C3|nr:CMGC family protein kinase [Histomonas meleagridis]KAH0804716.1 CMGC family protein kinase [Histomonas meleagridis]
MEETDPFDISNACINGRFNPNHPNISKIFTNVNLDLGPSHWKYIHWNPKFGDISRYKLINSIGSGRYSDVFTALQDEKNVCAIKILKPVNPDRVRRELKILSEVQGPNILKLYDIVIDPHEGIPSMVTEYCPNMDWKELFMSMTLTQARFYFYRILQALFHSHSLGIMHRDVKPLNVLCSNPLKQVKLGDWGLAEFYHPMRNYSSRVATRYYKCPEILLDYEYYDYAVDIWSVGVMLLEYITQTIHIFDGGDEAHQLYSVAEVIGGNQIIEWADKYRVKLTNRQKAKLSFMQGVDFESLIPTNRKTTRDSDALDLAQKMLIVDHKVRITAEEALKHPFFQKVRDFDLNKKDAVDSTANSANE